MSRLLTFLGWYFEKCFISKFRSIYVTVLNRYFENRFIFRSKFCLIFPHRPALPPAPKHLLRVNLVTMAHYANLHMVERHLKRILKNVLSSILFYLLLYLQQYLEQLGAVLSHDTCKYSNSPMGNICPTSKNKAV